MKKKEIKNLAKKIAQQELIIQNPNNSEEEKNRARTEIVKLSSCVKSIEDMILLDDAIQDFLVGIS